MQNPIYLLSVVAAMCGFYFAWSLGIRKMLLDYMREELFRLRFELFCLAMDGEIDFNDEAYRAVEVLFNGLLRFSHRLSFLTYIVSLVATSRAQKEKDYISVSALIGLKVSRLNTDAQHKILKILTEAHDMITGYMGASSLFFLFLYVALKTLDALGIVHLEGKKETAREVIEREAYFSETRRRSLSLSPA